MPLLIPALGGALVVAGIIGVILGVRRTPVAPPAPRRRNQSRLSSRWAGMERRSKILAVAGLIAGALIYLFTGWLIAVVLVPLAAVGLPTLLSAPPSAARIERLEALEEWTRALAGVLTVGVGLEEALRSTLRSTPEAIRPEVTTLVARLRARISTEEALRAFADDLNDATGDLVAAYLILGARRRGQGLASVLESLAESVAADVRARRAIEADRAKPRTTARWVTIITISVLGFLTLTGDYISPYGSPLGQLLLILLLSAYVGLLIWMRNMAKGEALPRFLGDAAREGAHA
ncbi:Type II secretion system protein [Nostocoides australiense Ben110]|jgi:tight adherence protein B|uniref:Type II secretion system protein n=1 Tax=Nostocoides australiense Ben110 TaxID=1193182 RepID=W6JTU3_9MICO|nr:type II secretion system F family protein [Tetrasphaera australiensis]CCH72763.1 Type II secretion system protein [Tetrasphaera australiensis Ben110]